MLFRSVHRDDEGGTGEAEVDGVRDENAGSVAHDAALETLLEEMLSGVAIDGAEDVVEEDVLQEELVSKAWGHERPESTFAGE